MACEIVGNILFKPRINALRVTVTVCDHTTGTVERDIRHTTPLAVTESTRLMFEPRQTRSSKQNPGSKSNRDS